MSKYSIRKSPLEYLQMAVREANELRQKYERAARALEYYADKENWECEADARNICRRRSDSCVQGLWKLKGNGYDIAQVALRSNASE